MGIDCGEGGNQANLADVAPEINLRERTSHIYASAKCETQRRCHQKSAAPFKDMCPPKFFKKSLLIYIKNSMSFQTTWQTIQTNIWMCILLPDMRMTQKVSKNKSDQGPVELATGERESWSYFIIWLCNSYLLIAKPNNVVSHRTFLVVILPVLEPQAVRLQRAGRSLLWSRLKGQQSFRSIKTRVLCYFCILLHVNWRSSFHLELRIW